MSNVVAYNVRSKEGPCVIIHSQARPFPCPGQLGLAQTTKHRGSPLDSAWHTCVWAQKLTAMFIQHASLFLAWLLLLHLCREGGSPSTSPCEDTPTESTISPPPPLPPWRKVCTHAVPMQTQSNVLASLRPHNVPCKAAITPSTASQISASLTLRCNCVVPTSPCKDKWHCAALQSLLWQDQSSRRASVHCHTMKANYTEAHLCRSIQDTTGTSSQEVHCFRRSGSGPRAPWAGEGPPICATRKSAMKAPREKHKHDSHCLCAVQRPGLGEIVQE